MGKIRTKKEEKKKSLKVTGNRHNNELQLKNTVGKLESDIGAISLGLPKSKILKKSSSSSGSSLLSSNFASRVNLLNKQKKKVRFCQNLVAEELKEQKSSSSEDAKRYFKVIHPSAIEKRNNAGAKCSGDSKLRPSAIIDALIPDSKVLMAATTRTLRNLIKSSTKKKKTVVKARKELFKKKMDLLKTKRDEQAKAKQRQETVIVGDMHPMLQALPALTSNDDDELETDLMAKRALEEEDKKTKTMPNKNKFSVKQQQKAILDSLRFFEASGVTAGLSTT